MWPFKKRPVSPEIERLHKAHAANVERARIEREARQKACAHSNTFVSEWDGRVICSDCKLGVVFH